MHVPFFVIFMTTLIFLALALATWRITNLFVDDSETGPFGALTKIRYWVGIRYNEWSKPYGKNVVAEAMTCVWCFSIWIGTFMAAMYYIAPRITVGFCLPFALSALSIIANKYVKG